VSDQRLRVEGRLLVNAQTRIEPAQLVVRIHKSAIGAEKPAKESLPMSCFNRRIPIEAFLPMSLGFAVSRSSALKFPGPLSEATSNPKVLRLTSR